MSGTRFIRSRTALVALGLATSSACVDGAPPADDPDRPSTTRPGMLECGALGRVELRDGKLVQDDMVLGFEDEMAELCDPSVQDELFSIGYNVSNRKWPGGEIPYRVRSTVPYTLEQRIETAIDHWEDNTPIDFVAYNENVHDDWVEFSTDTWCHAEVGRRGNGRQNVWLTEGKIAAEVRGVAISSEDWVYTWYSDYSVSAGTSTSADAHRAVYKFTTPPGYVPNQIVEIAVAADDRVYTWWNDGKVSIGTSNDLDAHSPPQGNFQVAPNKTKSMIVGIGIGPGDVVYTWYNDGTRSVGNSQNLATSTGTYNWPEADTSIFGMDFNSAGSVYTWYSDSGYKRTVGTAAQLGNGAAAVTLPGDCDLGATIHEIGHTVGLKHEQSRCDRDDHVNLYYYNVDPDKVGNYDKHCESWYTDHGNYDFASVMHYGSEGFNLVKDSITMLRKGTLGGSIPSVLDMAIASDDKVYTWWEDGTVTSGSSADLEEHRVRYPFVLPNGKNISNIEGIAIASNDRVYTYYDDATVSVGTSSDLGAYESPYDADLAFRSGGIRYTGDQILAVGISSQDNVYIWYEDGYASWGTSDNPGLHGRYVVSSPLDTDFDEIKGIDISNNNTVYTWYETGRASRGQSDHLSNIGSPYDVRGKGIVLYGANVLSQGDKDAVNAMY